MGRRGVWRWGEREIIYLSLHCHHQNDFCIKLGSDESHFNVYNCEGQSYQTESTDHNFWRERRAEADSNWGPSAYQLNALPLGQTGWRLGCCERLILFVMYIYILAWMCISCRLGMWSLSQQTSSETFIKSQKCGNPVFMLCYSEIFLADFGLFHVLAASQVTDVRLILLCCCCYLELNFSPGVRSNCP